MDFFDLIREMRKGKPDVKKAAKAMKILGWICLAGAVWNFVIYYVAPFDESPFNLPASYPYVALVSLSFLGALFLRSSKGIMEMQSWGKKLGQISIVLLIVLLAFFIVQIFLSEEFLTFSKNFSPIFIIFLIIFSAQFAVPAYFGIRYIGRLPINSKLTDYNTIDLNNNNKSQLSESDFKDALFPFGIFGTFAILIAIPILGFMIVQKNYGPETMASIFFPVFLFIFIAPIAYNYFSSPFQIHRTPIETFTGGGAISLFNGTWPFFRLLVYKDGVEIRVMFHRFFIPYNKMDELPEKVGFFSRGILIKSDLPGVPAGIRFQAFGIKRVLEKIKEYKKTN